MSQSPPPTTPKPRRKRSTSSLHNDTTDPSTIWKLNQQTVPTQYKIPAGYTYDIFLEQIKCIEKLNSTLQSIIHDKLHNTDTQYNTTLPIQHNNNVVESVPCMLYEVLRNLIDNELNNMLIPLNMRDYMSIGLLNKSNNTVYELNKVALQYSMDIYRTDLTQHSNEIANYILCCVSTINIHIVDCTINKSKHIIKTMKKLVHSNSTIQQIQDYINQYLLQFYNGESVECTYYSAIETKTGTLRSKHQIHDLSQTLLDLKLLQSNTVLLCHVTKRTVVPDSTNDTMQLSIELHNNEIIYLNNLTTTTTIQQIKQQVQQYINIFERTKTCYVIHQNEILDDNGTLIEYAVINRSKLQVLQVVEQYDDTYVYYNKQTKNNYIKLNDNSIHTVLQLIDYMNNIPLVYTLNDMPVCDLQKLLLEGTNLISLLYKQVKLGLILGNDKHGHSWITDEKIIVDNIINLVSPLKKRKKVYTNTATIQLAEQIKEDTTSILQHKTIQKPKKLHRFSFTSADHHDGLISETHVYDTT